MKKCSHINKAFIHPSIKIGGASIGQCQNECLPEMVVCAEHANKDALVYLIRKLVKQVNRLKKELCYASDR